MKADVVVAGAGVVGLTAARCLQEAGARVRVLARERPGDTTSAVAAAIWYPYAAAPRERVLGWARRSYAVYRELCGIPGSGVSMLGGIEYRPTDPDPPWWAEAVPDLQRDDDAARERGCAAAWRFSVPLVEMPTHLHWLSDRLEERGTTIEPRDLASLDEALAEAPVVVNCTGLGARRLAGDDTLRPLRGQVVTVHAPGLPGFVLDDRDPARPTYVLPRSADVVLGGTCEESGDTAPDDTTTADILRRCAAYEPALAEAPVEAVRVGLRPGRPTVRLEAVPAGTGRWVIHDYGHGGAGITLSWGCAEEVVATRRRLVS